MKRLHRHSGIEATSNRTGEPQALSIDGLSPELEKVFLAGLAQGIIVTNTFATTQGDPVYCPPFSFVLGLDEVKQLAETSLRASIRPGWSQLLSSSAPAAVPVLASEVPFSALPGAD